MIEITYFVHGTTTDNERGIATGWLPGELSATGIEQARELGVLVADQHFDTILCSDLKRAVDSAQLAFGDKYPIVQDERLREANYGDLNGKPFDFKDNLVNYINRPFPNGECYRDVEQRIRSFCDFLKVHYRNKHIGIVGHQGPQLGLDVVVGGKRWEQAIDEDWRKTGAWQPGWHYKIL